jgi:hypothetical protein
LLYLICATTRPSVAPPWVRRFEPLWCCPGIMCGELPRRARHFCGFSITDPERACLHQNSSTTSCGLTSRLDWIKPHASVASCLPHLHRLLFRVSSSSTEADLSSATLFWHASCSVLTANVAVLNAPPATLRKHRKLYPQMKGGIARDDEAPTVRTGQYVARHAAMECPIDFAEGAGSHSDLLAERVMQLGA